MSLLRRCTLLISLFGLIAVLLAPSGVQAAVPAPRLAQPLVSAEAVPAHVLYVPSNAAARQPLQVLVALHGMGSSGEDFAAPLQAQAERQGWVLVAPTFGYGDWHDPEQVRQDDAYFLPRLKNLVDSLPDRTGLQLRPRVLVYGFSRGGQLGHRFASFYPQSVLGVASFSCGSYTLPYTSGLTGGQSLSLAFPYGLADLPRYTGRAFDLDALRRVSFLIGVGARDNQPADLPRQWDPYLGTTRVDRALAYYRALDGLGIPAQVALFQDSIHFETDEMRGRAVDFLASLAP